MYIFTGRLEEGLKALWNWSHRDRESPCEMLGVEPPSSKNSKSEFLAAKLFLQP